MRASWHVFFSFFVRSHEQKKQNDPCIKKLIYNLQRKGDFFFWRLYGNECACTCKEKQQSQITTSLSREMRGLLCSCCCACPCCFFCLGEWIALFLCTSLACVLWSEDKGGKVFVPLSGAKDVQVAVSRTASWKTCLFLTFMFNTFAPLHGARPLHMLIKGEITSLSFIWPPITTSLTTLQRVFYQTNGDICSIALAKSRAVHLHSKSSFSRRRWALSFRGFFVSCLVLFLVAIFCNKRTTTLHGKKMWNMKRNLQIHSITKSKPSPLKRRAFGFISRVSPLYLRTQPNLKKETTFNGGSLGSRTDEERCEMRYIMRIAQLSESSRFWTHIALRCWSNLASEHAWSSVIFLHSTLTCITGNLFCFVCACEGWKRKPFCSSSWTKGRVIESQRIVFIFKRTYLFMFVLKTRVVSLNFNILSMDNSGYTHLVCVLSVMGTKREGTKDLRGRIRSPFFVFPRFSALHVLFPPCGNTIHGQHGKQTESILLLLDRGSYEL